MKLKTGPTGRISTGHVLDVARKPLERALKDYDPLLYVTWNPHKLRGWGIWEVRRRPEKKSVVDIIEYQGASIVQIEYDELNIINHVMDAPYLNYSILTKLKQMDMWENRDHIVHDIDYKEAVHRVTGEEKARKEALYNMKQNRRAIRDWMENVRSGYNPAELAKHWDSQKGIK